MEKFEVWVYWVWPFSYGTESEHGGWRLIPSFKHGDTSIVLWVHGHFKWLFLDVTWSWYKKELGK